MRFTTLLLLAGTALSFFTASHAASIPVTSYSFPGAYEIVARNEFSGDDDKVYYELRNTSGGALTATITILDTNPDNEFLNYAVHNDSDPLVGKVTEPTGSGFMSGTIAENSLPPFFAFLMGAGQQYVLELSRTDNGLGGFTIGVSAVPLPGAIWLFGSALLGFLGWSSRRRH
jgi:hypothetical protein